VVGPVTVAMGRFTIRVAIDPPQMLSHYLAHARVVDEFTTVDDRSSVGYCFVGVGVGEWPQLVVTQRFAPAGHGFAPGVLLVPETGGLFIGAVTRLLGYQIDRAGDWQRVFVDEADLGFWGWRQHGEVVLMSAELELAAWTTSGEKLWTTFVEPPWSYDVVGHDVHLDVMGTRSAFNKHTGPPMKP
jgi:hypothetical protein